MTNYEWLKTLDINDTAELLLHASDIWVMFAGNPLEVLQKWLESERIDCTITDCFCKNTYHCKTCLAVVDMRGNDK